MKTQLSSGKERGNKKGKLQRQKMNQEQLLNRIKNLKNYDTWKRTKLLRINLGEMNKIKQDSFLSIAVTCGYRNNTNQVLEDVLKGTSTISIEPKDQNNSSEIQQKIEISHPDIMSRGKRFSFLRYKNSNEDRDKISLMFSPEKSRRSQTQNNITSIQKSPKLRKVPRELIDLKRQIRTLPTVKQVLKNMGINSSRSSQNRHQSYNHSTLEKQSNFNQEKLSKIENNKQIFKKINNLLANADHLLQLNLKDGLAEKIFRENGNFNQIKHQTRSYWPNYSKYSISYEDDLKIKSIVKNVEDLVEQNGENEQQFIEIIKVLKKELTDFWERDQIELTAALRNAFQQRFNEMITIQKMHYKRNVKSYFKCIQDYKNQKKREEVRANGIKRFKRQTMMQKIKNLVPEKEEDYEI